MTRLAAAMGAVTSWESDPASGLFPAFEFERGDGAGYFFLMKDTGSDLFPLFGLVAA